MDLTANITSNESKLSKGTPCFFVDVNFENVSYFYPVSILTLVINSVFSLVAVSGNALIIYVFLKTTFLHTPSNALLCCLAFSDLLVGFLAQPAFVAHKIGEMQENYHIYCITRIMAETVGYIAAGVSTLTLSAISVERLLALQLHLRYKQIVTTSRVFKIIGALWIATTLLVLSRFLVYNDKTFNSFILPVLLSSLVITFGAYFQIFRCVLRHQKQIGHLEQKPSSRPSERERKSKSFSFLKYKKSTLTMAYILGIYLVCYVPFIAVIVARRFQGYTGPVKVAYICSSTLVFSNSSVNPLIYCWRISDIRQAVKHTLRKLTNNQQKITRDFGQLTFRNSTLASVRHASSRGSQNHQ